MQGVFFVIHVLDLGDTGHNFCYEKDRLIVNFCFVDRFLADTVACSVVVFLCGHVCVHCPRQEEVVVKSAH